MIPKRNETLNKAFRLNPVKIHHSVGLCMREIINYIEGREVEPATELTMHNFYSELENQISRINHKLNLVTKPII